MKQDREPFHAGERGLQALAGAEQAIQRRGKALIRDFMPEQLRQFFAGLSYVFAATLDPQGYPQANLLTGTAGFMQSPDPRRLMIRHPEAVFAPGAFAPGEPVALLGIDLANARRNRANGVFESEAGGNWRIRIEQSFGNCPQYIHRRSKPLVPLSPITIEARALIASSTTFFIASRSPDVDSTQGGGLDISHRGGPPGFVRWLDAHTLMFPDYPGNNFFNTLGNLSADARTGLLFIDFQSGQTVRVSGRAEIVWGASASPAGPAAPNTREVRIKVEAITPGRIAHGFQWLRSATAPQFATETTLSDLNRV